MTVKVETIGGSKEVLIADGSTVGQVVELVTGSDSEEQYKARLNGERVSFASGVKDGDTLSIVPRKVKGA